ncbi:MAG: T9SS type A sorting domain-containing protein, partial [Bacteroidales bacterium]
TADGHCYSCGSAGSFYRKAPVVVAAFTSSSTAVCAGSTVHYTDQSSGPATAWNWTFEGGVPASSSLQNPVVTYPSPGAYDVTLVVYKDASSSTSVKPDFIQVDSPVTAAPSQPLGPTDICGMFEYEYTSTAVPSATSYSWIVNPVEAGTITAAGTTGTLTASNVWQGAFTIKVAGTSACGVGPQSAALNVALHHQPYTYSLFSGGGYCNGQTGYEIKLEDSETGVIYQLYKDGVASGSPVPGTGEMLSFGLQPVGTYTVTSANGICSAAMQGASTNYLIDPPAAATQPSGPAVTCNNVPSTFTATFPSNGFALLWTLSPASAGTVSQPTLTSAQVTWNPAFSGSATVAVQGQNECGNGPVSPALSITVNAVPTPFASGSTSVCKTQEITYTTPPNASNTYVWAVNGGTISSGQGSNQITVIWGYPGTGTVLVTETSATGCTGSSQILTVTISECTGMADHQAESINIYPNPASDQLNISFSPQMKSVDKIIICNYLGQVVYQSTAISLQVNNMLKVDVSFLNSGTYLLKVISEYETLTKVFIKNNTH